MDSQPRSHTMPRKKPRVFLRMTVHDQRLESSLRSWANAAARRGLRIPDAHSRLLHELARDAHEMMDPRIWSQLPENLLVCVLVILPAKSLFRFRAVCKGWDALIFSNRFQTTRSQVHIREPYFEFINLIYCRSPQQLSSYNPVANKFRRMSLRFLPPCPNSPIASSGGLLCCSVPREFGSGFWMIVCNPMTESWRALPARPMNERPLLVSIVAESRPPRYSVIMAGHYSTEIFDSTTLSWRSAGRLPRDTKLHPQIAHCAGSLFCLTRDAWPMAILQFDLYSGVWRAVETGRLPGQWQCRTLVACKGSLFIVAKSSKNNRMTVCIWTLDQATRKWKEIAAMPPSMSERFFKKRSHFISSTGHGNLIFLTRDNCEKGALYNIDRDAWKSVHRCQDLTFPHLSEFQPMLDVFEPSFATA
ncbi:hypothetical protein MPTK1_2g25890 [Marchantia polymorpha subsp. ruderalis]|uniref:F-box domain-containing protein n=1 Tax=Marchantia polymorpha TaxID=3197 RepID=A0A2R6XBA6_MARPO|nr:hypothetical protein MARPO_0025s0090 [Marchantia polymorpha]BBN03727.1 hypothetical protein Mp_2g25890 [Marchantia polymorpha subsp. ruderalis]|eukprot:PTQ43406.1 hypothetical protein MARPO_0025s0090 [Marchantia polymorpha]